MSNRFSGEIFGGT
jgi:hypothetical protein